MRLRLIYLIALLCGGLWNPEASAWGFERQTVGLTTDIDLAIDSMLNSVRSGESPPPEIIFLSGTPGAGKEHTRIERIPHPLKCRSI